VLVGRHGRCYQYRFDPQLMPVWNFWPQTLQDRSPRPNFLSSLTTTEFSWLQNKHAKVVARGSRYLRSVLSDGEQGSSRTFRGP
jgi:hypothetical protein